MIIRRGLTHPWSEGNKLKDTLDTEAEREAEVHVGEDVHKDEWRSVELGTGHSSHASRTIRIRKKDQQGRLCFESIGGIFFHTIFSTASSAALQILLLQLFLSPKWRAYRHFYGFFLYTNKRLYLMS
jgi:hypothetical protein